MTASASIPHGTGLLLALERVRNGKVTAPALNVFADHDAPFPRVLLSFLRELIDHGQARVETNDEPPRVMITAAGESLLAELTASTSDPPPEQAGGS